MIHKYSLLGNPVEHSRSPDIHHWFAEQTQRQVEYTKTLTTENELAGTIRSFFDNGGRGLNITVPFKQAVVALCDQLSPAATRADAVNTIKLESNGTLTGHNTDGSGLLIDLTDNNNIQLNGSRILIAGAGGSVRGILEPLLKQQPAALVIANRTISKARDLANAFRDIGPVTASDYETLDDSFSLIINATSMSLEGHCPPIPETCINSSTVAYDLLYGKETPFMSWATTCNAASVHEGSGMLVEQAADAFFLWEDVRPKTRLILPKLRG